MKVLIVDDQQDKADEIAAAIRAASSDPASIDIVTASSLSTAARSVGASGYELIVLDLMLPYLTGGDASSTAGLEILRLVRAEGNNNRSAAVVGISAFPDEVAAHRSRFEELGVLILTYSDGGAWRATLRHIIEQIESRSSLLRVVDFVGICALEEERNGFRNYADEEERTLIAGLNVTFIRPKSNRNVRGAIVRLSRMGLVTATCETAAALNIFKSTVMFMPGICAGFSANSAPGQVILASPAWEYQAGKWSKDKFEIAPLQVDMAPETRGIIDHLVGEQEFLDQMEQGIDGDIHRPTKRSKPKLAPFVTGSAVIADAVRLKHIEQQHRKVAGLDMEAYGMYYAAKHSVNRPDHFFCAKTVVDLADKNKNDDLHAYGCAVSFKTCLDIFFRIRSPA